MKWIWARSIQVVTEEIILKMANFAHKLTGEDKIVLAGGVALNCVANGRLLREGPFREVWIQPAAGDAGGALGAALMTWYQIKDNPRKTDDVHDAMKGTYLGPEFGDDKIKEFIAAHNYPCKKLSDKDRADTIAELIDNENVCGPVSGQNGIWGRGLLEHVLLSEMHVLQKCNQS